MKFTLRNREIFVHLKDLVLSKIFHIFILSLILRLLYVNVNAPFVFHPDEPTIVNSTINLRYNFNPKHFDWPTLTYYLNYPIYDFFERLDSKLKRDFDLDLNLINFFNYYLFTRVFTAFIGSLTVLFIYFSLTNFGISKNVSLISSSIFSLMPFFLFRSAQALPDVPMLFFGVLMVYFISKHYISNKFIFLIVSSFCLGLSISSKYTGYLFGITLLGYLFFRFRFSLNFIKSVIFCGILIILGFLVGTPYALLDSKTFLISDSPKGALWQFQNVGRSDLFSQIWYFLNNLFLFELENFGYVPQIAVLVFIGVIIYEKVKLKKNKVNVGIPIGLFVIFLIQYFYVFWTVSGISSGSQRAQHFIPVIPFIIILSSLFFDRINYSKVKVIFVIFIFLNLPSYLARIESDPIVKYYYRTVSLEAFMQKGELANYNESNMVPVLEKIGYDLEKFDERKELPSNTGKIFSSVNLCKNDNCGLKVIFIEKNIFSNKILYVYDK